MKILIVWIVTCLIWSTVWLFIKLGLRDLPPVSFAGIRLFIALLVLLPFIALRRIPLPRRKVDLLMIAVTGLLLLGLNYALVFWGAQYISSGLTAVLQAATPAFGLVFAGYYLPQERFTVLKFSALLVGIGGVVIIFSNQLQIAGWTALLGCAAVVGGALCVACSYVLVKAHGGHLHPLVLTAGQMICGLVPLVVYGLMREGNPLRFHWTATAALSLLYLALAGSVAAFGLNYWLLQRTDATKILLMSIVEPPLAMLLGVVVLGEAVSVRMLWGSACILLSVGLILFKPADARN
ncbi:MAG TPA: DMT family transporter [Pyrinomonadaceae bacterium]|jgi:drug/metabolite transporter (DMT)-like permease